MILYLRLQKMLIEHLQRFTCILKTTVDKKEYIRLFSNGDLDYHEWHNALKRFFSVFPGAVTFDIPCY